MRADQLLVSRGLAPSRSAAQRLIERGAVQWRGPQGWTVPRKAGDELPAGAELQLTDDAELRWASRAGLKLEGALGHTGLDVAGRHCLDVGHGQLLQRLRDDARVTVLEGVNARHLQPAQLPRPHFDLVVGDLSFISLTLVLPALAPLLAPQGELLMLVKPQFELQPAQIGKGGLVKDTAAYTQVRERIEAACRDAGLLVHDWFDSPIAGGDGNREFFVRARPARSETSE
jgi:23S rRNA (cytidine1920-2'-O)/16S rRNA (cytidine1409-2'-O)-methyltransferase